MYGSRQKLHVYDYHEDTAAEGFEAPPPPEYEVEAIAIKPRDKQPVARGKVQWTPERRAEASRKAKERLLARA
jgi:hypothetical protein